MKRKWHSRVLWSLVLGIFIMSGCTSNQLPTLESTEPTPRQTGEQVEVPVDLEIPLDDYSASIAVPDFLTEEQQLLYRQAHCIYSHLFGVSTAFVDRIGSPQKGLSNETVTIDDTVYTISHGAYRQWTDFDALVHSVFTDDFWSGHNNISSALGTPIILFRAYGDTLCYLETERGLGVCHNENFPDEFRLESQSEDVISFTLIGHYSEIYPKDGETPEQRDMRRQKEYEYTLEFPMKLVLTNHGWRFDEFHSALVDEA